MINIAHPTNTDKQLINSNAIKFSFFFFNMTDTIYFLKSKLYYLIANDEKGATGITLHSIVYNNIQMYYLMIWRHKEDYANANDTISIIY
jgi:penicillin-binding protein-related factor A (putative recombinase)